MAKRILKAVQEEAAPMSLRKRIDRIAIGPAVKVKEIDCRRSPNGDVVLTIECEPYSLLVSLGPLYAAMVGAQLVTKGLLE